MKCVIVGAGPSLQRNLDEMEDFFGLIFATDKALVPMIKANKIPSHVITLENEERIATFFEDQIIKEHHIVGIHSEKSPRLVVDNMKKVLSTVEVNSTQFDSPVNVGLFAWQVAVNLFNADEVYLIGMDYAHSDLDEYTKGQRLTPEFNPHLNRNVQVNAVHQQWKHQFLTGISRNPHVKTINCTGDGALFGKGIKWDTHYHNPY